MELKKNIYKKMKNLLDLGITEDIKLNIVKIINNFHKDPSLKEFNLENIDENIENSKKDIENLKK